MMINKRYIACVLVIATALTTILIIIALNNKKAVNDVSSVTDQIETALPPRSQGTAEKRYYSQMPMMNIDGNDYIGMIEVPFIHVKLPVYSCWDEYIVRSVPCRYSGSIYDSTLIVGGINTGEVFDFLTVLNKGEIINFIDMTGKIYTFSINDIYHHTEFDVDTTDGGLILFSYLNDVSKYIFISCK